MLNIMQTYCCYENIDIGNLSSFFIVRFFFIICKGDVPPKVQVFHFQPWKSTAIVSVIYPEGKSEEKLGINIYGTAFIIINLCLH